MSFTQSEEGYEPVHPNPLLPIVNAGAGLLIVAMVIFSALLASSILSPAISILMVLPEGDGFPRALQLIAQTFNLRRNPTYLESFRLASVLVAIMIFVLFYVPFAVRAFWFGVERIGKALLQWRNAAVPDDVPEDLTHPTKVLDKMFGREKYVSGWKDEQAKAVFGRNVQFLSPLATELAQATARRVSSWIGRLLRVCLGAAVLGGLILWVSGFSATYSSFTGVVAVVLQTAGLWPSLVITLSPFALMAIFTAVVMVLEHSFVALLVPKQGWPADSLTKADRVVASTPPDLISHEFPSRVEPHRSSGATGKPNRLYRLKGEVAATSVTETGSFALLGVIEQQPRFEDNPNLKAARFWIFSGWTLVLVGLAVQLFFLLPPAFREAVAVRRLPDIVYGLTPIAQLLFIALGVRIFSSGRRMVAEAERLFDSYWFASSTLGYRIQGMTSRTELHVGRGQTDSIQTSSTVYRSEFLYGLTTATLLSEAVSLDGPRYAVGMKNTPESRSFLDVSVDELKKIVETGVAPISVDLGHGGLQDHVKANIAINAHRAEQVEAKRLQARRDAAAKNLGAQPAPRRLPEQSE